MLGNRIAEYLLNNNQFREAHKRNLFWRHHIDADLLSQLFSWRELNHCLSFNRITNDRFRMSTSSEHHSINRRAFRPVKDNLGRATDDLVVSELHRLMREGVTAVLQAVNELSATVCGLTERIAGELGARSTANAYISFGSVSGFGMHNDDHDVITREHTAINDATTRNRSTCSRRQDGSRNRYTPCVITPHGGEPYRRLEDEARLRQSLPVGCEARPSGHRAGRIALRAH